MQHYRSPDSEVTVCVLTPFLPHKEDVEVLGKPREAGCKGGDILRQVDHVTPVPVLAVSEPVDGHERHHGRDEHLLCL